MVLEVAIGFGLLVGLAGFEHGRQSLSNQVLLHF